MPFGFGFGEGMTVFGHVLTFGVRIFNMRIAIFGCFAVVLAAVGVVGLFDSCVHGGTKYKEGDHFVPNDTLIKTESPQQCVQCKCRQGLVLCEIENCPPTDCEAPLQRPQFCCLQCPGAAIKQEETSNLVFGRSSSDGAESGCFSNGMHRKNGSVWQPVIGPFGVMACVQCRCQEGNVICARLECGEVRCSQPRREFGQCCPVCSSLEKTKRKAFCLPKSSEVFVFKTPNVQNNSDRIDYAFVENNWNRDLAKIHTWNLRAKTLADVFAFSVVSRKEFRKKNFQIVGSISKKGLKKYSKRERKLRNNCLRQCLTRIKTLESSFVDFAAKSRAKCNEDEIDVADI